MKTFSMSDLKVLVINALDGRIPLMLQERYPHAEIICAEYFGFYVGWLQSLGFEVVKCWDIVDGKRVIDFKEVAGMKFDQILSNPPYQAPTNSTTGNTQGGFWFSFLKKSLSVLKDDGYLGFITPKSWTGIGSLGTNAFKLNTFREFDLLEVDFTTSKYFSVGIDICSYLIRKTKTSNQTRFKTNEGNFNVDIDDITVIPYAVNQMSMSIVNKVLSVNAGRQYSFTEGKTKNVGVKKVYLIAGRFITSKQIKVCRETTTTDSWGVSMPLTDEQIGAESVFSSKLLRYCYIALGGEAGMSQTGIIKNSPYLDLNRTWTDSEIYSHFNLTLEEIEYIEANVK